MKEEYIMAIKKRCIRCRQYLREDGTCQNPDCVRYSPPKEEERETDEKPETN